MKKILLLLMLISIIVIGCTVTNEISTTKKPPVHKYKIKDDIIYRADKEVCGVIVFSKNLAEDFNSAYNILETEKKDKFSKYCPDNPCHEIELESTKVQELKDLNGDVVNLDLYLIKVKDKSTGVIVHSLSEAIDEEGNLYYLRGCLD